MKTKKKEKNNTAIGDGYEICISKHGTVSCAALHFKEKGFRQTCDRPISSRMPLDPSKDKQTVSEDIDIKRKMKLLNKTETREARFFLQYQNKSVITNKRRFG